MRKSYDPENVMRCLAMAEMAAQDMAEAGLNHIEIAVGLMSEVHRQVGLAIPNPTLAAEFLALLAITRKGDRHG